MSGPPSAGIAGGAPPPASALTAAEAAARERDDRPSSAMKRPREWEGEPGPSKKPANEENRSRTDEQISHRTSPHLTSPRGLHRRNSSDARREEQRRTNETYNPSEAAHHPPTLPSIQHMQQPSQPQPQGTSAIPSMAAEAPAGPQPQQQGPAAGPLPGPPSVPSQQPKEERERKEPVQFHEPAARKMDVDEDYDDDGDDDNNKKTGAQAKRSSPNSATTGTGNGVVNGGSQSKQEGSATTTTTTTTTT